MARRGESINAPPRTVTIYELSLEQYNFPRLTLRIRCSTGTYIRAIARDLGRTLGCGAYVEKLRRTRIGQFTTGNSVKIAGLTGESLPHFLRPAKELVSHLPHLTLSRENVAQLKQGRALDLPGQSLIPHTPIAIFDDRQTLFGLAQLQGTPPRLAPLIILPPLD